MEKVLDRAAPVGRGCKITKNGKGLYDIRVEEESGELIKEVKNITFPLAVTIIEDYMYTSGRASHE